ncbi:MAG: N-6 DNA methylase [Micromonosporaceae bacterium]
MTEVSDKHAGAKGTNHAAARRIGERLWRHLDRYRGMCGLIELGDVVLILLYLRGRPAWEMLADGGLDVERAIRTDLSADREDPVVLRPLLDSLRTIGDEVGQLAPLVDLVDRLDFTRDVPLTQIFSVMLERIAQAARHGEFHTPDAIAQLAAALLDPAPSDSILDPCCKGGAFLAAVADRQLRDGRAVDRLPVAVADYSARSCAVAYLNLRLRGVTPRVLPNAAASLATGAPDHRYNVVTANPPFNLSHWSSEGGPGGRWRYGVPPAHNGNFAWLQYVVASLDHGGRAAVVMPYGAGLSENPQERSIRGAMVDDGVLSAVIALPGQMFTNTAIPVTLWLLEHTTADRPGEVLFFDATGLGTVQERGRRTLTGPDIDNIVETYQDWREHRGKTATEFAADVSIEKIRDGGYRLNPRAYITPTGEVPDLRAQGLQARELTQRLRRLGERAVTVDQTIEAHLKELSL